MQFAGEGWRSGHFLFAAELRRDGAGLDIAGGLALEERTLASFRVVYTDTGLFARIETPELVLGPGGIAPESLISPLPRELRSLAGRIEAGAVFARADAPEVRAWLVLRAGEAELAGMRLSGIDAGLAFDSLTPLRSLPGQTLKIGRIEAGVRAGPLEALFDLSDGTELAIQRATLGLFGGRLELRPTRVDLGRPEETLVADIAAVDLGALARAVGGGRLAADGLVDGEARLRLSRSGEVVAEAVHLRARAEGWLRWQGELAHTGHAQLGLLRDLLRDFRYRRLEARLAGPLAGELTLRLTLEGANPAVLGGYPVALDLRFEGPLGRILFHGAGSVRLPGALGEGLLRSLR